MASFRLTTRARRDLDDIFAWIAQDDLPAAFEQIQRIEATCRLLAAFPSMGSRRSWRTASAWMFTVSPWLIFYRHEAGRIDIVRVVHGARDVPRAIGPS